MVIKNEKWVNPCFANGFILVFVHIQE